MHSTYAANPVLIVCDDAPARAAATHALARIGAASIETADAEFAIEILSVRHDIRAIVAASNQIGILNGYELARIAARQWPYIRHVMIVGRAAPSPGELPLGAVYMPRPVDLDAVIEHLRKPPA